jgi:hypothetical protein
VNVMCDALSSCGVCDALSSFVMLFQAVVKFCLDLSRSKFCSLGNRSIIALITSLSTVHADGQIFLDKLYLLVCTQNLTNFSLTRRFVQKPVMPAFQLVHLFAVYDHQGKFDKYNCAVLH